MKSLWTISFILILKPLAFGQFTDSLSTEDNYNAVYSDENNTEVFSPVNINSIIDSQRLPEKFHGAIERYKKQYGCIANLYELYRIPEISQSQWDSIIPHLQCGPCWQKPKFIEQRIILTKKDYTFNQDTNNIVIRHNLRYKGKSENGFLWGFNYFFSKTNESEASLSAGFIQWKTKSHHFILGDFLPQTPHHLLFENNLMNTTSWNVAPNTAIQQHIIPYTSSIPNRLWHGMALSKNFHHLSVRAALDFNKTANPFSTARQWECVEWKTEKITTQYHIFSTINQKNKQLRHAIYNQLNIGKGVLQSEGAMDKFQKKILVHGLIPILHNQWLRLSYQWTNTSVKRSDELSYVHQMMLHKKLKAVIAWALYKESQGWEGTEKQEVAFRSQWDYIPSRHHIFYMRYELKMGEEMKQLWRWDGKWPIAENGLMHCRLEQHWTNNANGWLSATELEWKPMNSHWQIIIRQIFYSIPDWDLRIYMMDRELKGGMSIPAFNGQGKKTFIIIQHQSQWLNWAIKLERKWDNLKNQAAILHTADLQLEFIF